MLVEVVQREDENTTPVRAVQQWHVQPDHIAPGTLDDLIGPEGETGQGVVDGLHRSDDQTLAGQRYERHLVVVLQQDRHVPPPDHRDLLGDQGSDQLRGHRVCPIQQ